MATTSKLLNIIDFFEVVLNVTNLSPVQKMTLKAIRGESLSTGRPIAITHQYQERGFDSETEMFCWFSGKDEYIPRHYADASLDFGRRSGKSTTIGAGLAIYYATQFDYIPYLGTSPHATIPIISPTKEQAGEVFASIKNFFLRSPLLFQKFLDGKVDAIQDEYSEDDLKNPQRLAGGQIKLNNKVIIKVMAADISKIRGMAVPFAILDEVNFFGTENNDTKNTDKAIYEALAPATAQFQVVEGMALILKISSPNGETGLMHEDFLNKKDPDVLHLQVPSWWANPSLPVVYLEKQKKKGMNFFNREYGAQYTAAESAYLDPKLIDAAVMRGVEKMPYQRGFRYAAAMDYATKNDYWALAIGHKEFVTDADQQKKERVFIDFVAYWKGSDGNELKPDEIIPEICMYLKMYGISMCIADQYAFAALKPMFAKENVLLKEFASSSTSKLKFYTSLQVAVNSDGFRIVDEPMAIKHLKDLREKRSRTAGKMRIEHAANSHDDIADCAGLVVYQFDRLSPIFIGYHMEEEEVVPETKDALGRQVLTPTAQDLAEYVGNSRFYDNRKEKAEQKKEEELPEDGEGDNFWFTFD